MIIAFVLEGLIHFLGPYCNAVDSLTVPHAGLSDTEITGMNHLLPWGRKTEFPLVIKAFSEQNRGAPPLPWRHCRPASRLLITLPWTLLGPTLSSGKATLTEAALGTDAGGKRARSGDSYPGFLGSLSREPPPFSFLTSFSLLRLMEARSLLKEPLRFKDPVPS